jgi:homoserine O-acetyltransferase/O-succinyltransferase
MPASCSFITLARATRAWPHATKHVRRVSTTFVVTGPGPNSAAKSFASLAAGPSSGAVHVPVPQSCPQSPGGGGGAAPPPAAHQHHHHHPRVPGSRVVTLPSFTTVLGRELTDVRIKVECHGDPALPAARTVVIFPSFSHSSHVASNLDDPSPGWWQEMVGAGRAVDTRHFRVLCLSVLGSPFSPTNPTAVNRETGKQWRASFPQLSPTDLARCHRAVLAAIGVEGRVHAVVGSSLGGMQALQYASLYPESLDRLVGIACTGRTTPFTVALRRMQRRAILADPGYHGGDYEDKKTGPWEGLRIAREFGTIFYRSREEFDSRFSWSPSGDRHFLSQETWEVESYLGYAGAKFARRYDPNAYLLLSKCMDLQDLGDGYDGRTTYAEGAARITADTLLIGVAQDALIPMQELQMLADTINATHDGDDGAGAGDGGAAAASAAAASPSPPPPAATGSPRRSARFVRMDSPFGHDAFLKEFETLAREVRGHLERGLESRLAAEAVHNTGANAP